MSISILSPTLQMLNTAANIKTGKNTDQMVKQQHAQENIQSQHALRTENDNVRLQIEAAYKASRNNRIGANAMNMNKQRYEQLIEGYNKRAGEIRALQGNIYTDKSLGESYKSLYGEETFNQMQDNFNKTGGYADFDRTYLEKRR